MDFSNLKISPNQDWVHPQRTTHYPNLPKPDFDTSNLPPAIRTSMIAYNYLTMDLKLAPNHQSNPWHNILKDHPKLYKPYGSTLRYANLWSAEYDLLCQVCKDQYQQNSGTFRPLPAVWNCTCRIKKPKYFRGSTQPYFTGTNYTSYWGHLDMDYIITAPMPHPIPNVLPTPPPSPLLIQRPLPPRPHSPSYWSKVFLGFLILQQSTTDALSRPVRQTFKEDTSPGLFNTQPPKIPPEDERDNSSSVSGVILTILVIANLLYTIHLLIKCILKARLRRLHNNAAAAGQQFPRSLHLSGQEDDDDDPLGFTKTTLNSIYTVNNHYIHNSVDSEKTPWINVLIGTDPYTGINVRSIVDTGTPRTIVNQSIFNHIKGHETIKRYNSNTTSLFGPDAKQLPILFHAYLNFTFVDPITNLRYSHPIKCIISHGLSEDVFLGDDILSARFKIYQDRGHLVISATPDVRRVITITPDTNTIAVPIQYGTPRGSPTQPPKKAKLSNLPRPSGEEELLTIREIRARAKERREVLQEYAEELDDYPPLPLPIPATRVAPSTPMATLPPCMRLLLPSTKPEGATTMVTIEPTPGQANRLPNPTRRCRRDSPSPKSTSSSSDFY